MTDNFERFKYYIQLYYPRFNRDEDSYFTIEITRRGKDHPNLPGANYHFKTYFINKLNDIDRFKDEIKTICDVFKMRAYFSINQKSYYQVMLDTTAEMSRRIAGHDYKKSYVIWESCSGKYLDSSDKRWVVDIDDPSLKKSYEDLIGKEKILYEVKTKSGCHFITRPFPLDYFLEDCDKNGYPRPDVLKNRLSLLYENL
jgi:hypothetical protein